MSAFHSLTANNEIVSYVLHVAVPVGNNSAGLSYRTALVRAGFNTTGLPDGDGTGGTISAAEKAQILAGEVFEHANEFAIENVVGNKNTFIDNLIAADSPVILAKLQAKLKWFGHTRG